MSSLPHEVLLLVIRHLNREELLQCQLTCKQWRKASLLLLYTTLVINSKETAILYARTISDSPELGRYLKSIHFHDVFHKNSGENTFDNHFILDAVIQHCPNITMMGNAENKDFQAWTQLMHAATEGQLSNLKCLPQPSSKNLGSYIYTALLFKNSLSQLWLFDDDYYFGPQFVGLGVYRTLYDQIDQFKKLESLSLSCYSDKKLSYFDGLIDKCQHLKELNFDVNIDDVLPPSELERVIRPRPGIHTFECNWRLIDTDSQLEYVMRKFPSLKKLIITSIIDDSTLNCSSHTLAKFIQYVLSIPYFKVDIDTGLQDLLHIWTELMKTKHGAKSLTIGYQPVSFLNNIKLSSESGVTISFSSEIDDDDMPPHIQFFSEVGGTIRSLIINTSGGVPSMNVEDRSTISWLYDILERCPLLEEITTHIFPSLLPIRHTLQYPSVKRLVINLFEYTNSTYSLDCLSLNFPNLHQINFYLYYVKECYTKPITIRMPHTSLDLLTWNETVYNFGLFRGTEIYIKLKTDTGTKFYLGIRNTLFPINSTRFDFYKNSMRFYIRCKQLKELRIRRNTSPESDANLIFNHFS